MASRQETLDRLRKIDQLKAMDAPSEGGDDSSFFGNLARGTGVGLANVGRGVTNLALPESLEPEWATDEHIAAKREENKELLSTGGGFTGSILGETLATLPLGAAGWIGRGGLAGYKAAQIARAVGASAKGIKSAREAARAASTGRSLLTRTLAHPATVGGVEGAAAGAIVSDPGDRGMGAAFGAGAGGALGATGRVLKKALKGGFVDEIDVAHDIRGLKHSGVSELSEEIDPGLALTAKPGIMKSVYENLLANLPGVSGKIHGPIADAEKRFLHFVASEAVPSNSNVSFGAKDTMQDIFGKLANHWDNVAYRDITDAEVVLDVGLDLGDRIAKLAKVAAKGGIPLRTKFSKGATVSGDELWSLRNGLKQLMDDYPMSGHTRDTGRLLKKSADRVEAVVRSKVDDAGRIIDDNALPYENYQALLKASAAAGDSADITARNISRAGYQAPSGGAAGGSPIQELGQQGKELFKTLPQRGGIYQTLAATGTVGAAAGVVTGNTLPAILALGIPLVLAKGMVTPGFQRWLAGRATGKLGREALEKFFKQYQTQLAAGGLAGRQAAATVAGGQ